MDIRRTLIIAGIDLLILAELIFAVYRSAQGPGDDAAAVFLRLFVPAAVATFVLGRRVLRKAANDMEKAK